MLRFYLRETNVIKREIMSGIYVIGNIKFLTDVDTSCTDIMLFNEH